MPFASPTLSLLGPPTHSAVVVTVPEAEPVVGDHRRRFDESASWGVPAHVTVLYPFLDPARLDDGVHDRLTRAVGSVATFAVAFSRTDWFEEQVLWLAPEPDAPFRALTRSVAAAFPQHQPYGGVFDDVVPHLTVGMRPTSGTPDPTSAPGSVAAVERLRAAERSVQAGLPVRSRVTHVEVLAGRPEVGGSWAVVARLPLA